MSLAVTFAEHLEQRERQPPAPWSVDDHRRLQLALVPVAGKRVARRSSDVAEMIAYLGGRVSPTGPAAEIAELRRLLGAHAEVGPVESIRAGHAYLDLVAQALDLPPG